MNQESLRRIDQFVVASTQDLFKSYGMSASLADSPGKQAENQFTAAIGFTAVDLRGLLVFAMDRGRAASSLPPNLKGREQGDEIVADWVGDLSNQLLGRLKNRFGSVGIDISLSTPIVFVGTEIRHYGIAPSIHRTLSFDEGLVLVELMASIEKDFEVPEASGIVEPTQAEGEALFF